MKQPPGLLFDPLAIIRVLNEHGVRFVVIGGIAAGVQGAMWATTDLDITYARDREDLTRLAAALKALEAEPIELPPGVRVHLDARSLRTGDVWTLATRFGRLDLLGEPAPGLDYNALSSRARTIHGEETYKVASIDDLIAMKRVAARPKDLLQVEILRATAEELDREAQPQRDALERGRQALAPSGPFESAELIREERDVGASFKTFLASIPDVGADEDFVLVRDLPRDGS